MRAELALAVSRKAALIQRFIRSIGVSPDRNCRMDGARVLLDPDVLELVVHYIGNDLYIIALAADVPLGNPQPIPPEDAARIIERAGAIRDFLAQLKERTA